MKNLIVFISLVSLLSAQDKLAQTGFQFLSVSQDARAVAMGDAFTTIDATPNALFYNPAGLAGMKSLVSARANMFEWIADINYSSIALTIDPWNGAYGVFGFSLQMVDYGDFQGTIVWPNQQGFIDTEVFNPQAISIGFGYARYLTDRFTVGAQIKYVSQSLGKSVIPGGDTKRNVVDVFAFDIGTIYNTGYKSLKFGMSVRNLSEEIRFEEVGFQLPLTFKIGFSFEPLQWIDNNLLSPDHNVILVFDAVHPRAYPEYINLGTEYSFMNTFDVRAGYISNQDEYGFTGGFGISQFGIDISYGYTPFGVFGNIHRFSLGLSY